MNLLQGMEIKISGSVLPAAKKFTFNLGKFENNLDFHFKPPIHIRHLTSIICCNSLENGLPGQEGKQAHFLFEPESKVEVVITFEGNHFTVTLPDGFHFNFPNHLNLDKIDFLEITGDLDLSSVEFK
ncbi:galectin-1-like isoform X2 [Dromiciops gliroides]|nr:galectin-1-like isoform X2 [Dromiciops gliroides]